MARLMARDPLICHFIADSSHRVIPVSGPVIPAKAGIQPQVEQRASSSTALDTRLRGYDGVESGAGPVDAAKLGGLGYEF